MRRRNLRHRSSAWLCALALAAGLSAQEPPEGPPPEAPPPETEIELEEPEPPVEIEPESLPETLRVPVGGEPLEPPPPTDADRLRRATGPPVAAVEIRSDAPLVLGEVVDSLAFGVGDPLTEDAVRRSLKNLHATGVASRISVLTRPAAVDGVDGVEVVLALWANVRVDEVRITGDLGKLDRRELREALVQREGEPLVESRVLRGDFLLEERLQQAGYLDARVGLDVDLDRERRRATVTYQVEAGPRWQVGRVLFEGELGPFTQAELARATDIGPDDSFRSQALETAAEELREFYIERKYRTAEVGEATTTFDEATRRVDVIYPVEAGPQITFEVEGAEISRLRKQGLLPFLGDEGFDEALLLQAVDRIHTYFQEQGHYLVQVRTREEETPEGVRVVIVVDQGPVYELEEVRFVGNEEVSDDQLAELMQTSDDRLLGLFAGRLVTPVLESDLDNVRAWLALNGWAGYEVGPPEIDVEGQEIRLTIPVEEGVRRTVAQIDFVGVEALEQDEVDQVMTIEPGGPYHPVLVEDSLEALRSLYQSRGYADAQVSAELDWNSADTEADVEIQVFEGPQQVLGRVLIRGNQRTKDYVIRRALQTEPGDPISRTRLLEMERNLYQLGIFSRVSLEMIPAELGTQRRDVVVRVQEGTTRSLTYGIGFVRDESETAGEENQPRGLVGYTQRNVFGRAYRFLTDARVGEDELRFRTLFEQPYIRNLPVGMLYELFTIEEDRESFQAERWVGRIEALHQRERDRFTLAYDYRLIEPEAFQDPLLVTVPDPSREDGTREVVDPSILSVFEIQEDEPDDPSVQVSSIFSSMFLDRRDDVVSPTRGWTVNAQLQYAFPFASAEPHFAELFLQHTNYLSLGDWGVLAGSVRVAAIEPLTSVPGSDENPLLVVPLDERLFSGGRTTHRAFDRFELGIVGETLFGEPPVPGPIGGTGLALVNLEYRFPVFGPVGGTLFTDVGQVWRDWQDFDTGELRIGVGIGARYLSPIGPLRVDVGFKVDREENEPGWRINLLFGNPF